MSPQLIIVLVAAATMLVVVGGALLLVRRFWVAVPAGKALIVDRPGRGRLVSFNGMVVFPGIHHGELMDTSPRTIRIERRQSNPLVTRDGVHMLATATFVLRVTRTEDDVLKVAETIGVERANRQEALDELFRPKLDQALEAVAGQMSADDFIHDRYRLVDNLIKVIGVDLYGMHLDDAALHDVLRADG